MDNEIIIDLLKEEMVPALGVTEPAAIALATSTAYRAVGGNVLNIRVTTDQGLYKNGYSCSIPGTNETGNEMAAILGALAGNPDLELRVLERVKETDISKAKELREKNVASVTVRKGISNIFIDATVTTDKGVGRAVIKEKHTHVVMIEVDGRVTYHQEEKREQQSKEKSGSLRNLKLIDFTRFIHTVTFEDIKFTLDAVEMNEELAKAGMKGSGMGAGAAINTLIEKQQLTEDIMTAAQMYTGYAVDARMGGEAKPAMSICGSGDHGIIATMPLLAISKKRNTEIERLARAIALSYLITIYIKEHAGRLSAFCGCAVAAGTGASAAIVYLLEGTDDQIAYAINNMGGNITGIICDGGNFGCTLKAITAAGAATMSALFALDDITIPCCSGIVGRNVEETMKNIGKIASPGMVETDDTILDIMQGRYM